VIDNHSVLPLANSSVLNLLVIAPAVKLTVEPFAKTMRLSWTTAVCKDTTGPAPLKGYDIYRKMNCDTWVHQPGETGVPASAGYTWIGSTDAVTTNYTDNWLGLATGKEYTYVIVAHYKNGALSYASNGACALITGIYETNNDIAVTIAPNPTKGSFTLVSEFFSNSTTTISIKNSLGQVVYTTDVFMTKDGQVIDVNLSPGPYMIQVSNRKGTAVKRMILNK
jgi:hypothetical protein